MGCNWIIDVIADLRNFARENDLPLLHKQLEEAGLVAEVEIASIIDHSKRTLTAETEPSCAAPLKLGSPRQS